MAEVYRIRTGSHIRTIGLVGLLGLAMITATFLQGALSVLSIFIVEEFRVSRSAFGLALAVYSLSGALLSPWIGGISDTRSKGIMLALFTSGALSLVIVASAPQFGIVIVGCLIGGVALGAANPVTNRLITERIELGKRGLVVGLKQAGPPVGLLMAGLLLPIVALTGGWRLAMIVSVLIPTVGLMATQLSLTRSTTDISRKEENWHQAQGRIPAKSVVRLSLAGFGVAVAMSAAIAFVPLYAQQEIGASASVAGALAGAMGLAGVVGRVVWSVIGGSADRPSRVLIGVAVVATFGLFLILISGTWGIWLLWIAAIAVGFSLLAWHAVAWLSVIQNVDLEGVGRISGVVQLGNSVGFAVGPLLMGLLIDMTHSYSVAWGVITAELALTSVLLAWTGRKNAETTGTFANV